MSVLVPARDEEQDIERCLRALLAQDYPGDRMEILVIDGNSSDGTASRARELLADGPFRWKVLHDASGTTPSVLNTGLAAATGDVICRVDARSIVPVEYVRLCSETLVSRDDVVVTGGRQIALARDASLRARALARALNNRYGMGLSRYRSGSRSGPSDTVYLGAYRRELLRSVGGWDLRFETNQDFDLNRRLSGMGTVWFDGRLVVGYVPRQTFWRLFEQYHRFGRWKVRYWMITGDRPRPRQVVLLGGVAGALAAVVAIVAAPGNRRRRVALTGVLGAAGLLAIDEVGSSESASMPVRVAAAAGSAVVGLGWSSGVLRSVLGIRPARPGKPM